MEKFGGDPVLLGTPLTLRELRQLLGGALTPKGRRSTGLLRLLRLSGGAAKLRQTLRRAEKFEQALRRAARKR